MSHHDARLILISDASLSVCMQGMNELGHSFVWYWTKWNGLLRWRHVTRDAPSLRFLIFFYNASMSVFARYETDRISVELEGCVMNSNRNVGLKVKVQLCDAGYKTRRAGGTYETPYVWDIDHWFNVRKAIQNYNVRMTVRPRLILFQTRIHSQKTHSCPNKNTIGSIQITRCFLLRCKKIQCQTIV